MTSDIFCNWLLDFERDKAKKNRFIVPIMDNYAAYPKNSADNLPHIKQVFLPPNLNVIDSGCDVTVSSLAKSLTLLDAIHMLKSAWEDVKTVLNYELLCQGWLSPFLSRQDGSG